MFEEDAALELEKGIVVEDLDVVGIDVEEPELLVIPELDEKYPELCEKEKLDDDDPVEL